MRNPFLFFCLIVLLSACAGENKKSNTVKSNDIYQGYTLSIGEDNIISKVEAEFRAGAYWDRMETEKTGGDAVELVDRASITFNGEPLQMDNSVFTGCYYKLGKKIPNPGTFTWVWTDNDGKTYTNTAKMNSISIKESSIYTNSDGDLVVKWSGGPVGENESVTVAMEGMKNDKKNTSYETTSKVGETSVSFTPELLKNYDGQSVDISVTRQATIRVSEGTKAGGVIKLRCEGNSISTSVAVNNSLIKEIGKMVQ